MTQAGTGNRALLEALRREGVHRVFGNPGSTEMGWLDLLVEYPDIQYLITLHEDVSVGMADGYALATGEPGVASVHTTPGTTHALGNLFNASVSGTPLVVLAGQQDSRLLIREPFLASDIVQLARQYVKWAWQVSRADEIAFAVHQAFKIATDPPPGPTLVVIPRELYDQACGTETPPPTRDFVSRRTGPDRQSVRRAAELLVSAERPAMICGPGARRFGSIPQITRLAETLAIPVYDDLRFPVSFPTTHPFYLGLFDFDSAGAHDLLMVIGQRAFLERKHELLPLVPRHTKIVHVDVNPREIGRLYPVEVGVVSDPGLFVEEVLRVIPELTGVTDLERFEKRRHGLKAARAAMERDREQEILAFHDRVPISCQRLVRDLRDALPGDGILVMEAINTHQYFRRLFDFPLPDSFFAEVGGSLGWGVAAAMGVKLANPHRPVVAVVGDGSFMYYPQALWTAVKYRIPVATVICNNRSYLNDKMHLVHRQGPSAQRGDFSTVDITNPDIDYVKCAEAVGAWGAKVERPEDLRAALGEALARGTPAVLDVVIDPWQNAGTLV